MKVSLCLVLSLFLAFSFCSSKFHRKKSTLPFLCPANITSDTLQCDIEIGDFRTSNASAPTNLTIIEYNIDRNAFGGDSPYEQGLSFIISLMNGTNSSLPTPDVLVMSELARDCYDYGNFINGPKELAKKLGFYYAYVVEYISIDNQTGHQCTIGNGLFSKYTIENIGQLRFQSQCCKFPERWGGRIAVFGDLMLENSKNVTIYSTHLESGQNDIIDIVESLVVRVEQINEIIDQINTNKSNSNYAIISGDFNAPFGDLDSVNIKLELNGYLDSHSSLDYFDRDTCPFDGLSQYDIFVFDYVWAKGESINFYNPIICNLEYSKDCYGASDHCPIMVTMGFAD